MTLVTLFAPIAVFSSISGDGIVGHQVFYVEHVIIAPLWTFAFGDNYNFYYQGFFVLDPLSMIGLLPVTFFGFVFGVLVVRLCQDKCSRRGVYLAATASVAFPLLLMVMSIPNSIAWRIAQGRRACYNRTDMGEHLFFPHTRQSFLCNLPSYGTSPLRATDSS